MTKERATALPDFPTLSQLRDTSDSKLIPTSPGSLPSKQWVAGSNPARDATELVHPQVILAINDGHTTRSRE